MPNAPPSSVAVSDRADAAPARSTGAAATTMSVPNAPTGATPNPMSDVPITNNAKLERGPSGATTITPTAARPSPAATTSPGEVRRESQGASIAATISAITSGNSHSPVTKGPMSCTSWRYWATNRSAPETTKTEAIIAAKAATNIDDRNSARSTSG